MTRVMIEWALILVLLGMLVGIQRELYRMHARLTYPNKRRGRHGR